MLRREKKSCQYDSHVKKKEREKEEISFEIDFPVVQFSHTSNY